MFSGFPCSSFVLHLNDAWQPPNAPQTERMSTVALGFLLAYDQTLHKEALWRDWVERSHGHCVPYFHCASPRPSPSAWVEAHRLPFHESVNTSYFHVVQAYVRLMQHALRNPAHQWVCFVTDACVPVVSPATLRQRLSEHGGKSLFGWRRAWWDIRVHTRANLAKLPPAYHLGHEPWFVLSRADAEAVLTFVRTQSDLVDLIDRGGLANETLFAVALAQQGKLAGVANVVSTATDWTRRSSATSPHVFVHTGGRDIVADRQEVELLARTVRNHPACLFVRKIDASFPDSEVRRWWTIHERSVKRKRLSWARVAALMTGIVVIVVVLAFAFLLSVEGIAT